MQAGCTRLTEWDADAALDCGERSAGFGFSALPQFAVPSA